MFSSARATATCWRAALFAHPTGDGQVTGGGEDPVGFEVAAPVHLGGDPQHMGLEQVDRQAVSTNSSSMAASLNEERSIEATLIDGGAKSPHPAAPSGWFLLERSLSKPAGRPLTYGSNAATSQGLSHPGTG
jgi:hypothetical protein